MSDAPRKELRTLLQPLIPKTWTIVLSERSTDADGTVLYLQQRSIARHPTAGTGVHLIGFQCTVTVSGQDLEAAEDRLDDELTALVQALDDLGLLWEPWTKALFEGRPGYQSTVYLTAQKEL